VFLRGPSSDLSTPNSRPAHQEDDDEAEADPSQAAPISIELNLLYEGRRAPEDAEALAVGNIENIFNFIQVQLQSIYLFLLLKKFYHEVEDVSSCRLEHNR